MIRYLSVIAALMMVATNMMGGKSLELKEITQGKFRPEVMSAVQPLADGESYAQIAADGRQVVKTSFRTGKQTAVLFDTQKAHGANIDKVDGYVMSPDGKRMLIQTKTQRIYRHSFTAEYYIYTIATGKVEPLSDGGAQQSPVWSPDGTMVAFVRDNNIHLVKLLYDNAESAVTKDGERNKVINGVPDWVNEEEFATSCSMVFTADSKQLVWIRYDETEVKEHGLPMTAFTYKYPRAGEQNAWVSVMSFDVKSRQTRTLQVPLDADGYIPRIMATADASQVAVFTLNRHQDNLRLYMVNPLSTVAQLALEDKAAKYFSEDAYNGALITPRHIVMMSERSGYNAIYVYNLGGQLQRSVTAPAEGSAKGVVSVLYGYDEATGDVYYAAHAGSAVDQAVYVTHQNGKTDCLTKKEGWSTAVFSTDFKSFINTWGDINTPPVTALYATANRKMVKEMVNNKTLAQAYNAYDMGRKELFTLTTVEGVVLNAWMVKPADFDASRQYPVIMYQYGGPGSQQVKNAWNIGMSNQGAILEQYLAQQGYIVVCVDGRGTGGRGADFEKCTYLHLGLLEARDQVEAALWLGQQSYVDKSRIAIWGWSYGGFNTLMSMSEGRGVFCCGIAIAPPTDWRFYDTIYTERYMRTPQENAEGYDDNPIHRAGQLHGALMICHGMADDNVHYENTAEYTDALITADKDYSQLVYNNRNHSIYGGNTRNHLFRQCVNFFNRNMKN